MKFTLPANPAPLEETTEVIVGNVYAAKGGAPTRYWVIVGVRNNTAIMLGLDAEGVLCSANTYGKSTFDGTRTYDKGRPILGFCAGLEDLVFDIVWKEKP